MTDQLPELPAATPLRTLDEIASDIRTILDTNDVKVGSKKARTIECSFLQGMMCADIRYHKNAYLLLCLLAGRSILDP